MAKERTSGEFLSVGALPDIAHHTFAVTNVVYVEKQYGQAG